MGLFRSKTSLEPLKDDIWQLRKQVGDLETAHKRLLLEWEELYDKVRHQMARMSKRAKDANGSTPIDPSTEPGSSPGDSLDPVSRSIMLRRGMGTLRK